MKSSKYLIIGGGIAGTTAAETIRKIDKTGSITIVSEEPYPLYSRIMLSKPNFFLEKIPFKNIWLKPEDWYQKQKIALILGKTATQLSPEKKIIKFTNGEEIKYEKLLLATGGRVRKLTVPGHDKQNIFYLRTLDDAKQIIAAVKTSKTAAVVGGGFIGFEMCDMLKLAGLDVNLIIRENYIWQNSIDETSGKLIETAIEQAGINIIHQSEVEEFIGSSKIKGIKLNNGDTLSCDLAVVGIGCSGNNDWLSQAGLKIDCGISTNEYLETNLPDIWSAGDAAKFKDLILEEDIQLGNWLNAQMHGVTAGSNMAGDKTPYRKVTSYTTHGFGLVITYLGDGRLLDDRQIIIRGKIESGAFSQIIIMKDQIVGAILFNNQKEQGALTKLIDQDIVVKDKLKELADTSISLNDLIP